MDRQEQLRKLYLEVAKAEMLQSLMMAKVRYQDKKRVADTEDIRYVNREYSGADLCLGVLPFCFMEN